MIKSDLEYRERKGFETKRLPTFVKQVDEEQGVVEHFIAVMGNIDDGGDVIEMGAFAKTVGERSRKVRVLDMHQATSVLHVVGKPLALREVGRSELTPEVLAYAPDATGGLLATTQYAVETDNGRNVFKLIKGGFIDESSIGYDAISFENEVRTVKGQRRKVRILKELRLWEYSNVVWGMNPATATVGVKGLDLKKGEGEPVEVPTEEKPFVGEHACRLQDPGDFEPDSFRRTTREHEGKEYAIIFGKIKGEDGLTEQAYRYPTANWDETEAKTHCDEHDGILFEPAAPASDDKENKAVQKFLDLPLAARNATWSGVAAERRVRAWAGGPDKADIDWSKYYQAFMWRDGDNPEIFGAYKLPYCDVINDKLVAVPRGIYALANPQRGIDAADVPEADRERIKSVVSRYYAKMREEFEDNTLMPSWEKSVSGSKENKESLTERINDIESAFRARFNPGDVWEFYVREVFDDHLVAVQHDTPEGTRYYQVPYTVETDGQDEITYQFPSFAEWTEGEYVFIEKRAVGPREGKPLIGRVMETPVPLLSDFLAACLHLKFTYYTDNWLKAGLLSREERLLLSSLIGDALDILHDGMPAELAGRPLDYRFVVSSQYEREEMAGGPETETGMVDATFYHATVDAAVSELVDGYEAKAGRVLSSNNARKIQEALAKLHEVLMTAGLIEAEDVSDGVRGDGDSTTKRRDENGNKDKSAAELMAELKLLDLDLHEVEVS